MKDRLEDEDEEDMDSHDMEDMNTSTLVISESALSINGEDSRDSCNQLSIDTGETDQDLVQTAAIAKPSIRIAKGLTTRDNNENHAPAAMGGFTAWCAEETLMGGGGGVVAVAAAAAASASVGAN